jgi:hypothetical protein
MRLLICARCESGRRRVQFPPERASSRGPGCDVRELVARVLAADRLPSHFTKDGLCGIAVFRRRRTREVSVVPKN